MRSARLARPERPAVWLGPPRDRLHWDDRLRLFIAAATLIAAALGAVALLLIALALVVVVANRLVALVTP